MIANNATLNTNEGNFSPMIMEKAQNFQTFFNAPIQYPHEDKANPVTIPNSKKPTNRGKTQERSN